MLRIKVDEETSLQLIEEQHAEELFALVDRNRQYLRRWLPWLDQNTALGQTRAFIQAGLRQFADRSGFSCGLWHGGRLAGVVGLHYIDWTNRKSSIGYWLDEAHQGRGLITKACAALLDHIFGDLRLNCVEIGCAVRNDRSRAVPERLGFVQEGVLRQREWLYDHFEDLVVHSMLAAEWAQKRRPVSRPEVEVREARPDDRSRAQGFYKAWAYEGGLRDGDRILIAERAGELIGVVRLCEEEGVLVLRGMRVARAHQGQGIGRRLLATIDEMLGGRACYCLAYGHLEAFYGQAGFARVAEPSLPPHLEERLSRYRTDDPTIIGMRRGKVGT